MKLTLFLSSAFFAAGIFAAPTAEQWAEWRARRGLSSGGIQRVGNTTFGPDAATEITTNWAGAVIPSPPAGETFQDIVGSIIVPTARGAGTCVAIWVGVDGSNSPTPLIQGGIFLTVGSDGTATYDSWTEWYPDNPVFYDQTTFPFAAGDQLLFGLSVQSGDDTALLIIENQTNPGNYALTQQFSASDSSNVALGQSAEWVVERPPGTTLMDFGTVLFNSAIASTSSTNVDLSGATALSIQNSETDNTIIAVGSFTSNTVSVSYTSP